MSVDKHTFSHTMVAVTECAFCMHSWMNVAMTAFTAEFSAVLRSTRILLFFWDWPERKTALLFWPNTLRHILSWRTIDNQNFEKPPLVCPLPDILTRSLTNVYPVLQNLQQDRAHSLPNYCCSDLRALLLEQFSHYYPVQIFLAVIWAYATFPRHYDCGGQVNSLSSQQSKLLVSMAEVVGSSEENRITLPTLKEKRKCC